MTISLESIARHYQCGGNRCECSKPQSDGSWKVHCPIHAGERPAMDLTIKDGKFFVHCHAGCQQELLVADLKAKGLWPSSNGDKPQKARIAKTYDYHDVNGKLIFQVCRMEPKRFLQRRPDPARPGEFIWKMEGVTRVPYRLPEIIKADTIFIPEGEKDGDRLTAIGLTATCNPGGANKWREEYNKYFPNKAVVILPDNDQVGRGHAQDVARNLHGIARSVKVLELPGLPDKGDVSDWINAGGTKERLLDLVAACPEWEQQKEDITIEIPLESCASSTIPQWPIAVQECGVAATFAQTYSNYLECPEPFLFMSYLTFLGHVISDKITLQSEIKPQPRLYVALVGESADARKSTSIIKTMDFFKDTLESESLNTILGVGSAEGLAKFFDKIGRGILVFDELKTLVQKCQIKGSVLLPCITTLFESRQFHSRTLKHEIKLEDVELCLLGASTLETYKAMFTANFTDIGLINRLFVVIADSERKFSIPPLMPESVKLSLKGDLKSVLSFVGEISKNGRYAMPITHGAKSIFDDWYFSQGDSIFNKRLDTYGHRLMPLLAVNEWQAEITPDIAEKVVSLLRYQKSVRSITDPISADNQIAAIEQKIRRLLLNGPMRKRDLEKSGNKHKTGIKTWEYAIANLSNAGELIFDINSKVFKLIDN